LGKISTDRWIIARILAQPVDRLVRPLRVSSNSLVGKTLRNVYILVQHLLEWTNGREVLGDLLQRHCRRLEFSGLRHKFLRTHIQISGNPGGILVHEFVLVVAAATTTTVWKNTFLDVSPTLYV